MLTSCVLDNVQGSTAHNFKLVQMRRAVGFVFKLVTKSVLCFDTVQVAQKRARCEAKMMAKTFHCKPFGYEKSSDAASSASRGSIM